MPVYWVINYTDFHDVDEETVTISLQGDWGAAWPDQWAGVFIHNLSTSSSYFSNIVASSNMKNSQIIRIGTMSTKISQLVPITVELGSLETMQVSYSEICIVLHPLLPMVLLPKK